ncbi:MAG: hypothetical protein HQ522_02935 [Bacteroidetes bacterium]|nr:hypothetical protein [Bacteroidota bacterium]
MQEYGIGGTEVKGDASEAFAEIPQNRTLLCEKLTTDAPIKPNIVGGLQTIDDVFEHYKPKVEVEFEDSEGVGKQEKLSFSGLSDFGIKGITAQSEFLQDLTIEKDQYQKIIKQLKSNKLLRKTLEKTETKADLLGVMYALIKELEEA